MTNGVDLRSAPSLPDERVVARHGAVVLHAKDLAENGVRRLRIRLVYMGRQCG